MAKINTKAVILARVSSKAQEDGYSLDAQTKLIRTYCARNNLDIIKEFRISETASKNEQRNIFREMLAEINHRGINHLVVEKTDRLTRNFKDAVVVDDWLEQDENRRLHMVKESLIIHKHAKSDTKLMWNIFLAIAKKYTDNLREEVMKGWDEKLAQGWMPAVPPPGYKTITENGRKIHVIDESTAFMIERAFKYFLLPEGCVRTVAEELRRCGLTTGKGNPHSKSAVHKILTNKFYVGTIQFNGNEYPGAHEPLLDKALFNKVQKKMNRRNSIKSSDLEFLFKGLIRCSTCGAQVTWQRQKGRHYGSCQRRSEACKHGFMREDRVEEVIIDRLGKIDDKDGALFESVKTMLLEYRNPFSGTDVTKMEKLLTAQLRRLKMMDTALYDDKLTGLIDQSVYVQKAEHIKLRVDKVESRLSELELHVKNIEDITTRKKSRYAMRKLYLQSGFAEKRLIIDSLLRLTSKDNEVHIEVLPMTKIAPGV